jgi:uncharacterized protein (TIGR02266 family)
MAAADRMKQLLDDYRRLSALERTGKLLEADRTTLALIKDVLLEEGALQEAGAHHGGVPRLPRAPLSMEVQFPDEKEMARAMTRDLSPTGVAIATAKPLPVGSRLRMKVKVPGWSEPLAVGGQVMWAKDGSMGVAFQELAADDERRLKDLVLERTSLISKLSAAFGREKEKAAPAVTSSWTSVLLRLSDEVLADVTAELLGVHGFLAFEDPPPEAKPDVVVVDVTTAAAVVRAWRNTPIVMINVSGPEALMGELATLRPRGFVRRPASAARIVEAVRSASRSSAPQT